MLRPWLTGQRLVEVRRVKVVLFRIETRPDLDAEAYEAAFQEMLSLVSEVDGFVSLEAYAGEDGSELAVARFESDAALSSWRELPEHRATQRRGREEFFASYQITVTDVDREYRWSADEGRVEVAGGPAHEG